MKRSDGWWRFAMFSNLYQFSNQWKPVTLPWSFQLSTFESEINLSSADHFLVIIGKINQKIFHCILSIKIITASSSQKIVIASRTGDNCIVQIKDVDITSANLHASLLHCRLKQSPTQAHSGENLVSFHLEPSTLWVRPGCRAGRMSPREPPSPASALPALKKHRLILILLNLTVGLITRRGPRVKDIVCHIIDLWCLGGNVVWEMVSPIMSAKPLMMARTCWSLEAANSRQSLTTTTVGGRPRVRWGKTSGCWRSQVVVSRGVLTNLANTLAKGIQRKVNQC